MDLKKIKLEAQKEIKRADDFKSLDRFFKKYLGRKGQVVKVFNSLKNLSPNERKKIGREANLAKIEIERMIKKKSNELKEKLREIKLEKEEIDVTRPGKPPEIGHLHPLTLIQREIIEIFQSIGFSVVEGPEIENEWYNFDALNIPKDHPARDMWDTFWLRQDEIKNKKSKIKNNNKLLLRTHTSPVQIRYMEKHNPPLRIIVPGRVFRHEATDRSHEFEFWQVEGLMVDKNISVANFKAVIEIFLKNFFGKKEIKTRLRPGYFPFTEPSFELDIQCIMCKGKGCSVCKNTGWLEMIPGGMVHPNVFKNSGLNPKFWRGFAFGAGMNRLAMMKYRIDDIRLFNSGDLRFLKQF